MNLKNLMLATLFCAATGASAHPAHDAKKQPAGFDTMKDLVGTWEGTTTMGGKEMPCKSTFEVTSGGSVIMEKMAPGTEHEMVNMYYADGDRMSMTHYCAIGNQPHMMMKKGSDAKTMTFEMEKPMGVANMKESHMHAVKFTMVDKDTMTTEWTNMDNGKPETAVFKYKRKK